MSGPAAGRNGPGRPKPLGQTIGHVGLALTRRLRRDRPRRRLLAGAPLAGPVPGGRQPGGDRGGPERRPRARSSIATARSSPRTSGARRPASRTGSTRDRAFSTVIGYASTEFGTAGLERTWNAELTGVSNGDPIGDVLRKFRVRPVRPAEAHPRRSRRPLQQAAIAGLGDDRGAVVMLDPRTGEILALASTPTYDTARDREPGDVARRVRRPSAPTTPSRS